LLMPGDFVKHHFSSRQIYALPTALFQRSFSGARQNSYSEIMYGRDFVKKIGEIKKGRMRMNYLYLRIIWITQTSTDAAGYCRLYRWDGSFSIRISCLTYSLLR
jgi:hypothetical protein